MLLDGVLQDPETGQVLYHPFEISTVDISAGTTLRVDDSARWSRDFAEPVVDLAVATRAFVATAGGEVWCLDVESGEPCWRYLASGPAKLVATRDVLYVVDASGAVVALPVD